MPTDYAVAPSEPSEPRFSEDDIDEALDLIRERADTLGPGCEIHAAVMIEAAEHFHRFLIHER